MIRFNNKILYSSYISQVFFRNISKFETISQKAARSANTRFPTSNEHFIQEELLITAIKDNVPLAEEWFAIKQNILSKGRQINEVTFDAQALGICVQQKNYAAGKTFVDSIKSRNEELNLAAVGKFMRLYYVCNENNKCKNDEEFVLSLYYDLKKKYPILASMTAENVIHALSLTKDWKECIDLLENLKLTAQPSASTYSAFITAAFVNNEDSLGWDFIKQMIATERLPLPIVYKTWIEKINSNNTMKSIEDLFEFFSENEIFPTKDVTNQILELLKPEKYSGTYTTISTNGVCKCCQKPLQEIKINNDEFEQLKPILMDNVIIGKNVFNKSTPEELEKFKCFISNIGSCDIVVDGLNVAYSAGTKKNSQFYAKLLANVVRHYRTKSKKVLILGREHMNKWPKTFMQYVFSNAKVFFAENLSHDDPFLLYATMSSGLGTSFLSRDLMRGHLYLLMNPNLKRIFRRWQQLHQHSVVYVEDNGHVHIKAPFPFLLAAQKCGEGWHVPYIDSNSNVPLQTLDLPKNWLCLRKVR